MTDNCAVCGVSIDTDEKLETDTDVQEGDVFIDTINDERMEIVAIDGNIVTVQSEDGSQWEERMDDIVDKIQDNVWKPA